MQLFDGLNYRQWQQRNSTFFKQLSQQEQEQLRKLGYFNVSWLKVQRSWTLLQELEKSETQPNSLFDHRLKKGDLQGSLRHSIQEAEEASKIATEALEDLKHSREKINQIASKARSKHLLL